MNKSLRLHIGSNFNTKIFTERKHGVHLLAFKRGENQQERNNYIKAFLLCIQVIFFNLHNPIQYEFNFCHHWKIEIKMKLRQSRPL